MSFGFIDLMMSPANEPEVIGEYKLSVQDRAGTYSGPGTAEIALWYANAERRQWLAPRNGNWPECLAEFAGLYGDDDVAGYVPLETIDAIRAALRADQGVSNDR